MRLTTDEARRLVCGATAVQLASLDGELDLDAETTETIHAARRELVAELKARGRGAAHIARRLSRAQKRRT